MKKILFFLTLLPYVCAAQTGPAGIGTLDGSSALRIWLTADDLDGDGDTSDNPANNSPVASWINKSGTGINYAQPGSFKPVYRTGTPASVFFQASTASYNNLIASRTDGTYTGGSVFLVTRVFDYGGQSTTFFDDTNHSLRVEQFNNTNRVGFTRYRTADYASTIPTVYGTTALYSWHKLSSAATVDIRVNNLNQSVNVAAATAAIPYQRIGGAINGVDEASGDYYEVVAFNTRLNTAQIYIMENYLSAKYGGITLQYDIYKQDNAANGNYDFDVAGIGRVTSTAQHTDARGTGIVRISNPSNLGDNEYLIWGHDGKTITSTETVDVPAGIASRLNRVWRVSEANNAGTAVEVGDITMRFDLSALGAVTVADLRLLVNNGTGNFSEPATVIISGATDLGGNIYQFSGVSAIANNARFTVATAAVALPVDLLSFTATVSTDRTVQLAWQTATEVNNQYFGIERSGNGKDWEAVTRVRGAGFSSTSLTYRAEDPRPLPGTSYYRLQQIDFDGTSATSPVQRVYLEPRSPVELVVYPNPATRQLTVEGPARTLNMLSIFNALGQKVDHLVRWGVVEADRFHLDLNGLPPGAYLLVTPTSTASFIKK